MKTNSLKFCVLFFLLFLTFCTLYLGCKKLELEPVVKVSTSENYTNLSYYSVTVAGSIIDIGIDRISDYGHCYSTDSVPTIFDFRTNLGWLSNISDFTSDITQLQAGTVYFYRAFATCNGKTTYGNEYYFKTFSYNSEIVKSLVAHWKFEDNANDETGVNNGTLINGDASLYVAGHTGKAIDLSGSDFTCIVVPSNAVNDFDSTVSFTMSALMKCNSYDGAKEILFKGFTSTEPTVPGSKGKWIAMSLVGTKLRLFVDDNTTKTNLDFHDADRYLHEGGWNHIVGVRDLLQDSIFLFINGVQVGSLVDNTELDISSSPLPWVIGGSQNQDAHFDGMLDEVSLYNKALSAAEIAYLTAAYGIVSKPD